MVRRLLLLFLTLAAMLAGTGTAHAAKLETAIAPGPVIQGHAKVEEQCESCHKRFDRAAQDRLCGDCHKDIAADVRDRLGYHGRQKPQACKSCHTDHKGRTARIVELDQKKFDHRQTDWVLKGKQAGADIDLIVRGACMLPPGLPGQTDRIRVRSVVGRMLEHSRVLYYRWGDGPDDEALYLSSADWMSRNMLRRIEIAWPVRDVVMRQRVIDECLVPYLLDGVDAWQQLSDGRYERAHRPDGHSAQRALMARYQAQD